MKIPTIPAIQPYAARLRSLLDGIAVPDRFEALRSRLRARAARWLARDAAAETGPAAFVPPRRDAPLAPMRPLRPPASVNDNPLAAIEVAVERELRARGHLR